MPVVVLFTSEVFAWAAGVLIFDGQHFTGHLRASIVLPQPFRKYFGQFACVRFEDHFFVGPRRDSGLELATGQRFPESCLAFTRAVFVADQ